MFLWNLYGLNESTFPILQKLVRVLIVDLKTRILVNSFTPFRKLKRKFEKDASKTWSTTPQGNNYNSYMLPTHLARHFIDVA